jgi:predicted membrane protein
METNRPTITPQGFVGVFIVLLGIVFTLDNLGLVESRQILQYWPLAPIGIGLLIVIHASETRDWIRGTVWLAAGSLLLARNIGWLHFRIESFWPLLLVFFGLHIIFKARQDPSEMIERRVEKLRRRQERWQRRAERWKAEHPHEPMPFGQDWANQWNEQWKHTQSKFQEDWHQKFHEKFNEDWADKLKHSVQKFTTGTSDAEHGTPVDVHVDVPPAGTSSTSGTSGASTSGATGATGATREPLGTPPPAFESEPGSTRGSGGANGIHRISMFAFMSGVNRRVRGAPFFGGNLTAVMGGIELDLTQAQLPEDAVVELFAFWGGIEIRVPREWSVVNQGFALMGSVEDKTGNLPQRPGTPRLVLRGMALMGGVEIKN